MALHEIVAYKKSQINEKKTQVEAYRTALKPTQKSLHDAIKEKKTGFIFEIKPSSPSKGVIKTSVDVTEIARIYAPFAAAISVLADEKYFGGSPDNVRKVSEAVFCPVLFKDVIVSPLQVYEARYVKADAVLLMLSVLDRDTYLSCKSVAESFNMSVITEVHTKEEIERAVELNADIIGINNRNLKTLLIDLQTTRALLSLVPKNALVISESGYSKRQELKDLASSVNGFLIGTSLMSAARVDLALRELLFGRVKICGLTNKEDAMLAYNQGAYYGGLNLSSVSKRRLSINDAQAVKNGVPLQWGGVFVNQPLDYVVKSAQILDLDFVQIHGDETKDYVEALKSRLKDNCELWRAVRQRGELINFEEKHGADRILLDNAGPGEYGGTGLAFDWSKLADSPFRHDCIMAGGINPANVAKASELKPFAIDIASGVEDGNPRKKSLEKIQQLFQELLP